MPAAALALLLASALPHVGWNLILKRTPERCILTFWTMLLGAAVTLLPTLGRP